MKSREASISKDANESLPEPTKNAVFLSYSFFVGQCTLYVKMHIDKTHLPASIDSWLNTGGSFLKEISLEFFVNIT